MSKHFDENNICDDEPASNYRAQKHKLANDRKNKDNANEIY